MKRIGNAGWIMAVIAAGMLLLTACSEKNDDDRKDLQTEIDQSSNGYTEVYEGKWTVDKHVIDTARLEVVTVNKQTLYSLRFPENYLLSLCFPDIYEKTQLEILLCNDDEIVPLNHTNQLSALVNGYNDSGTYLNFGWNTLYRDEIPKEMTFDLGTFDATVYGVHHSIKLLAKESGTIIYRNDTKLYTISIPIECLLDYDYGKNELNCHNLPAPITIYFNTTKRIR